MLGSAVIARGFTFDKLIKENTECPDISFGPVDITDVAFRGHIDGRPHTDIS